MDILLADDEKAIAITLRDDLERADHRVTVVNSPLATTQAVAEHVIALLFSLARSIPAADASLKSGLWHKKDFLGVEVKGKVLGVIGLGNIGGKVTQLAHALGIFADGAVHELRCADQIQSHFRFLRAFAPKPERRPRAVTKSIAESVSYNASCSGQ